MLFNRVARSTTAATDSRKTNDGSKGAGSNGVKIDEFKLSGLIRSWL